MARIRFKKVGLTVEFYREGNKFIAYSPTLQLSTCGDTQGQAKRRFEEALSCFLEEAEKMGTLDDILLECGWQKIDRPQKHWQPPIFIGQTYEEVSMPCPT